MDIFVSGGTGFMGTHLCSFLKAQGHSVAHPGSAECDLRGASSLSAFSGKKYDLIFHLAAWTQAGDFCLRHPGEQWLINQRINTNMLDWWQCAQPQAKLVFMGTSCAYAPQSMLREEEYMAGEPIESLYTYAMTKRMLFQGARALERQYGMRWLCAVPSTLYGGGYHLDGRQMHFIFDLIRKILRGKEYGEKVILWGDGEQRRELVLVDDFVRILWRLVEKDAGGLYNIGAGEEHSIRDFAARICETVQYPESAIRYDTSRYTGARSKCLCVDKIKGVLPEYSLTPLAEGLSKTIRWFYESRAFDMQTL